MLLVLKARVASSAAAQGQDVQLSSLRMSEEEQRPLLPGGEQRRVGGSSAGEEAATGGAGGSNGSKAKVRQLYELGK